MAEDALRITGLGKRRRARRVLQGVDLTVGAGETLGLVGLNGAGKTTLIKAICDLVAVDEGRISLFGVDHRRPAARRVLSFLPERFVPPATVNGFALLRHVCHLSGQSFERGRAAEECAGLGLEPAVLRRPVREYSKGMAQKLGLAACFLTATRLLLLDEPMSGLDPRARHRVKTRLLQLRAAGVAILFSTHLLEDVAALCSRVAVLHEGRVVYDGDVAALGGPDGLEAAFLALIDSGA